jgi:hypothetical protein
MFVPLPYPNARVVELSRQRATRGPKVIVHLPMQPTWAMRNPGERALNWSALPRTSVSMRLGWSLFARCVGI